MWVQWRAGWRVVSLVESLVELTDANWDELRAAHLVVKSAERRALKMVEMKVSHLVDLKADQRAVY